MRSAYKVGAALWCAASCTERDIVFETIEEDCTIKCHIVSYVCDNAGDDSAEDKARCITECLRWSEDSREQGGACAKSYEDMLVCVGMLETCDEVLAWGTRDPASECAPETQVFDQTCEEF